MHAVIDNSLRTIDGITSIEGYLKEYDSLSETNQKGDMGSNLRTEKLRPLVAQFYSDFLVNQLPPDFSGIYLLSGYDPTCFHIDFLNQGKTKKLGNWDYVDCDFMNSKYKEKISKEEQGEIAHLIKNPELVSKQATFYSNPLRLIKGGFTTMGNKTTQLIPWSIGSKSIPSEINFESYDVLFFQQDVFVNGTGLIKSGLAKDLLREGGYVFVHSDRISHGGSIEGCIPLLSSEVLDSCLLVKR
jgi:hypothetical protein